MESNIKEPLAYFKWCLDPMTLENLWEEFEMGFISNYGRIDRREGNRLFFENKNEIGRFDDFDYFLELKFRPERKKIFNLVSDYAIETITEESNLKFSNYIRISIVDKINQLIKYNIETINKHSIMLVNFQILLKEIDEHYHKYLGKTPEIDSNLLQKVDTNNHSEVIYKIFHWLKEYTKNGYNAISPTDYDCFASNLEGFLKDKNFIPKGQIEFFIFKNNLLQYLFGILFYFYPSHCTKIELSEFVSKFILNFKEKSKKNTFSKKYRTPPDALQSMEIPDFIKIFTFG